jgi:hypothetical protein
MKKALHYIENNKILIEKYESLYRGEVNVEKVKKSLKKGKFDKIEIENLYRFRIFLDGCMLLFMNEKTEKNRFINLLADKYIEDIFEGRIFDENIPIQKTKKENREKFRNFINNQINDLRNKFQDFKYYDVNDMEFKLDTENLINKINQNKKEFICIDKEKNIVKKLKKIRNSIAHMQHGNYAFDKQNNLITFGMYNMDEDILKFKAIIFEPIFHNFIGTLFSNNLNYGIPNKLSIIYPKDSKGMYLKIKHKLFKDENKEDSFEIKEINRNMELLFDKQDPENVDALIKYVNDNSDIFEKIEEDITELIFEERIKKLCERYKINRDTADFSYTIKFYKDIETELSNLLFHMSRLNDWIIEYKKSKSNEEKMEKLKNLNELEEDEISPFIFKLMFLYLRSVNVLNRLEDNDLEQIDNKINIEGFKIKTFKDLCRFLSVQDKENEKESFEDAIEYLKTEYENKIKVKEYILDKFRNSIAHGKIEIEVNAEGEIIFMFIDEYKKTKGIIEISASNLEKFVLQEKFYENLNNNAPQIKKFLNNIKQIFKI